MKTNHNTKPRKSPQNKSWTLFTALIITTALILMNTAIPKAQAGGSNNYNGQSFFLFDLFRTAPNSKYRKTSPQVRGFRRKVGGYSYKYPDTIDLLQNRPYVNDAINDQTEITRGLDFNER